MTTQEISNRTVKALAIASYLHAERVKFSDAVRVSIAQGPFWSAACEAVGRKTLSVETRQMVLYFLAALEIGSRKLRRVK